MEPTEAGTVLQVLAAAWPSTVLPASTTALWMGMLGRLDVALAYNAASDLIDTLDWMPTIAQFRSCYAEQVRLDRLDAQPNHRPDPPAVPSVAEAFLAGTRAALTVQLAGGDGAAAQAAFDGHRPAALEQVRTHRCPCRDLGFVVDDDLDGTMAVHPCQRCNPVAYERWAGGHCELNHRCSECGGKHPARAAS